MNLYMYVLLQFVVEVDRTYSSPSLPHLAHFPDLLTHGAHLLNSNLDALGINIQNLLASQMVFVKRPDMVCMFDNLLQTVNTLGRCYDFIVSEQT